MVCHLGFLILPVRFFDTILVLCSVVDLAMRVGFTVDVGMVKVIRDRTFKVVCIVFITITGIVVLLCFFVVVCDVGVFEVFIDRELIRGSVVIVGEAVTVVLLYVFVVDFNIGVFEVVIDRKLIDVGEVLICVPIIVGLLCVAGAEYVLRLNVVA